MGDDMVYYCLLIVLFLCGFVLYDRTSYSYAKKKVLYLCSFSVTCILVMGLRGIDVGVDTKTYQLYFDILSNKSWSDIFNQSTGLSMETGYACWMKVFAVLGFDYYVFQFVNSIIYICGMVTFLNRNTKNIFYCSFIFLGMGLFLESFNLARQMLAVMFCVNGWWNVNNGKVGKGALLWGISCMIHRISVLFLIVNIIILFKNNRWVVRIGAILAFVAIFQYNVIIDYFAKYVPFYSNYYKNAKVIHSAGLVWVIWIIILFFALFFILKKSQLVGDEYIISIFSMLYVVFNIIGLKFNYVERIGLYFLPYTIILYERFGETIKSYQIRRCYYCFTFLSFVVYFLLSAKSAQYIYVFCF